MSQGAIATDAEQQVAVAADKLPAKAPVPPKDASWNVAKYTTGALATMGACVFSNPLEVVKTRLQLQGELQKEGGPKPYRNVFQAFKTILVNEGVRGIQRGLVLGLMYQAAMNGTRLGSFDLMKEKHRATFNRDPLIIEQIALAGTAGALGSFAGSPFYLVKTQQQAKSPVSGVGYQHSHDSIVGAFRHIYNKEGIKGLWRGATGSVPRLIVGSSVQLTTYAQSKKLATDVLHMADGLALHTAASMLTGCFVAIAMNPFDVITTRLYNQPVDPVTRQGKYYTGWFDCLRKTATAEGLRGFYKGVGALYLRIGPHTVLTFVFWEQLKRLVEGEFI